MKIRVASIFVLHAASVRALDNGVARKPPNDGPGFVAVGCGASKCFFFLEHLSKCSVGRSWEHTGLAPAVEMGRGGGYPPSQWRRGDGSGQLDLVATPTPPGGVCVPGWLSPFLVGILINNNQQITVLLDL